MKKLTAVVFTFILLLSWALHSEERITPYKGAPASLENRVQWAHQTAKANGVRGFWIGYSVKREMRLREYFMGTMHFHGTIRQDEKEKTLHELIYGTKPPQMISPKSVSEAAREALERSEETAEPMVQKELAMLIHFANPGSSPDDFEFMNLEFVPDLKKQPVYWLYGAEDAQSIAYLEKQYGSLRTQEAQEDLVSGIGAHGNVGLAFAFLKKRVESKDSEEIRATAAYWIGQANSQEALNYLENVVNKDASSEVREHAVSGIANMKLPAAHQTLMKIARTNNDVEVREVAVHYVGEELPHKEAIEFLESVMKNDPDEDVKEVALHAISEIPGSEPKLIAVARGERNSDLRESAIHWLGESKTRESLKLLEELAWRDPDEDIRQSALHSLGERDGTVEMLLRVAEEHPDQDTREMAIHMLAEKKEDSRAKNALKKIIED